MSEGHVEMLNVERKSRICTFEIQYKVFSCSTKDNLMENLTASCNAGCHCSKNQYNPVCGSDNVLYFSSCYAGCTGMKMDDGVEVCLASLLVLVVSI